jgi:hypothetical protein
MFYFSSMRTKNEQLRPVVVLNQGASSIAGVRNMDAVTYLKEASALLGLLLVVYLWSLVAMALQVA